MKRRHSLLAAAALLAGCSGQVQPTAVDTPAPGATAHANLAQLMRGIPFTFANIVFDAQSEDPGAERKPAEVAGGATATFANVYGGWQQVENSALALAESATLIMIPGRTCENGKPVPVNDEAFRAAAAGLADAGRAAYAAARSKNMDAIVEVSGTVSEACARCHEPYRDFDDPKDRCNPVKVSGE
jgi:hypothetical protein